MINIYGYCEKHNEPYGIKPNHGSWVCECPKCRAEGLLDVYTSNKTEMLPVEKWTVCNYTMPPTQIKLHGRSATDNPEVKWK